MWDGPSLTGPFTYSKTVSFKNVNRLYDPWHMDLFAASDETGTKRLPDVPGFDHSNSSIAVFFQLHALYFTIFSAVFFRAYEIIVNFSGKRNVKML